MEFPLYGVADDRVDAALTDIDRRIWQSWYTIRYDARDPVTEWWGMVDALLDYVGAGSTRDRDLRAESARVAMRTAAEAAFGAICLERWPSGDQDIRLLMINEAISSESRDFHYLSDSIPPVSRWMEAFWLMILGGVVSHQGAVLVEDHAPEVADACGESVNGLIVTALSEYIGGPFPESYIGLPPAAVRAHHLDRLAAAPITAGSEAGMLRALLADDEAAFEHERESWLAWHRAEFGADPEPRDLLPLPVLGLTALAVHAHGWRAQADSGWLPAGLPIEIDGVPTVLTVSVPAHPGERRSTSELARTLKHLVADAISNLARSPRSIFSAFELAELSLRAQCAAYSPGDSPHDARLAAVHALQLGCAMFELTAHTDGVVECEIAGQIHLIPALGPSSEQTVQHWITTFYLGLICTDPLRLHHLSYIPVDSLRSPRAFEEEFYFRWVRALQTWFEDDPEWAVKLGEAITQSKPEIATTIPPDYLNLILYQPINLFHALHRKDERAFNDTLTRALRLHRDYWSDKEPPETMDPDLALGLLAIACLAQDCGHTITVKSDYLPPVLLQRDWPHDYGIGTAGQ
ncbi:Imm49 family immunity protein [Nocardia sp. NPDC058058]|uniref:immunity 49 family protein n=1 Tax=Nocardia sp. NPDC058058 TaxID=3346317 RepID=UPI0036D782D1